MPSLNKLLYEKPSSVLSLESERLNSLSNANVLNMIFSLSNDALFPPIMLKECCNAFMS